MLSILSGEKFLYSFIVRENANHGENDRNTDNLPRFFRGQGLDG